jgi:hypothetical protein
MRPFSDIAMSAARTGQACNKSPGSFSMTGDQTQVGSRSAGRPTRRSLRMTRPWTRRPETAAEA